MDPDVISRTLTLITITALAGANIAQSLSIGALRKRIERLEARTARAVVRLYAASGRPGDPDIYADDEQGGGRGA